MSVCATRSQVNYIFLTLYSSSLSLRSCGNGTSFAFTSYIIVSAKFCNVTFLNNFYFVSFFYRLFICQIKIIRHQRKIRLVTLSKRYLYKFFFQSFFLVYWASFFFICLYFWNQIKHLKLRLKHYFWRKKRAHCIAYNNICTRTFVQQ